MSAFDRDRRTGTSKDNNPTVGRFVAGAVGRVFRSRKMPPSHGGVSTHRRRWGLAFAFASLLLLLGPVVLSGVGSDSGSSGEPQSSVEPGGVSPDQAIQQLLSALPPELSMDAALGPVADLLRGGSGHEKGQAPDSVSALMDIVRRDTPWDPVPVPDPPRGQEPLLSALGTYARTVGVELPSVSVLRDQIRSLLLQDEAERALAQLVLAYAKAVELEAQAVTGAPGQDLDLLESSRDVLGVGLLQEPERTSDGLEVSLGEAGGVIDHRERLRAADLLLRAIEETRDAIALPASLPAAWPDTGDPDWDKVFRLVAASTEFQPTSLPPLPGESLGEALENLARVHGVDSVEIPSVDHIPPSLADAVAHIVTARHVGLASGDVAVHSLLLLDATRTVEPTLKAWAAIMELSLAQKESGPPEPDLPGLLRTSLSPADATPSQLLAHGRGLALPGEVPEPPPLAVLLEREGLSSEEAEEAARSLPPRLAQGTAVALDGMQRLDAEHERVLGGLDPEVREVVVYESQAVMGLLALDSWLPPEATLVEMWAQGMTQIGAQGVRDLQQAQVDTLASVEAAVAVLKEYAEGMDHAQTDNGGHPSRDGSDKVLGFIPRISLIQTANAQASQPGCLPSSFSRCSDDVWFRTEAGRGVLITGPGSTTIGPAIINVNPGLMIDLGGDDRYLHPVGAVQESEEWTARVAIDLAGDDEYTSDARLAQGAAEGLGKLGVVWNVQGNDVYRHRCLDPSACVGAQGYGANGGVGVLVDERGSDVYDARQSAAHGFGHKGPLEELPPPPPPIPIPGPMPDWGLEVVQTVAASSREAMGLLLDTGTGDDSLLAERGQGYASGDGSLGVLINNEGGNSYSTGLMNTRFQGGHDRGTSSMGILVDLGGQGTAYSNVELPQGSTYFPSGREERVRTDDTIWLEVGTGGFGLGIDSTLEDEDGDGFPNLVETIVGTDPQDPEDNPGDPFVWIDIIVDLLENPPDPEELDPFEFVEFATFRDDLFCADEECTKPMSILHLGDARDNTIDAPALVMIELGGDNTYQSEVAGPGDFWFADEKMPGLGSYALDLSGDDLYTDPGGPTQGSAESKEILSAVEAVFDVAPVSLLLNLEGDDRYIAGQKSQASVWREAGQGADPQQAAAWLIDFAGNDTYTGGVESQGHAMIEGASLRATAALIDLDGDDHYTFFTQGRAVGQVNVAAGMVYDGGGQDTYVSIHPEAVYTGSSESAFATQGTTEVHNAATIVAGIFIDQGHEFDTYLMVNETGKLEDVSHIKNNQTQTPSLGGLFVDGLAWQGRQQIEEAQRHATLEDEDGDGAPTLIEYLLGTDPEDPEDHPGSLWQDPMDLDGEDAWLRIPGLIAIGGRGDSNITQRYGLMVSLGGDNTYSAAGVGGSDLLAAQPDDMDPQDPDQVKGAVNDLLRAGVSLLLDVGGGDNLYAPDPSGCRPNLGGASIGVAILADTGGENVFRSSCGITQGAGSLGVGVLVTWDATNQFEASSALVSQGAGQHGIGLLASFGSGGNEFIAPDGQSQGFGDNGVGILWTGSGDDRFHGGAFSQGSSATNGLGVLYSAGGNDRFVLIPDDEGQGSGQGASEGGVGVLVNVGGDNQYLAEEATRVQGVGIDGLGALLDLGGNDVYMAKDEAQGFGAGSGLGLLFDLHGSDAYFLAGVDGQGAGDCGLFVDAAGSDHYGFGGSGVSDDRNNEVWTNGACGVGIDFEEDAWSEALSTIRDLFSPIQEVTLTEPGQDALLDGEVTLRAVVDAQDDGQEPVDRLTFFVNNVALGRGTLVEAVDDRFIYEYDVWDTLPRNVSDGVYELRASAHARWAVHDHGGGFVAPDVPGTDSPPVLVRVDNPPVVDVDLATKEEEDGSLRGALRPGHGPEHVLSIMIGRDLACPEDEPECVDDPGTGTFPGGRLQVVATNETNGKEYWVVDEYRQAGLHEILLDGFDQQENPWVDGAYALTVRVSDNRWVTTKQAGELLIDGTPPDSRVLTPELAGADHRVAGGFLRLIWDHTDHGGSGVASMCVFRVDSNGDLIEEDETGQTWPQCPSLSAADLRVGGVGTGSVLRFVTSAIDILGNAESPCLEGEEPVGEPIALCYRHKAAMAEGISTILLDFEPPVISNAAVNGLPPDQVILRPGEPVNFTVDVQDPGVVGVDTVSIRLPGDHRRLMHTDGEGTYWYDGWGDHNQDLHTFAREEEFIIQIRAVDKAGNEPFPQMFTSVLDSLPPRVSPLPTQYVEPSGDGKTSVFPMGRPGVDAILHIHVEDIALEDVRVDTSQVASSSICEPMDAPGQQGLWTCRARLLSDLENGDYQIPINATDVAGNFNNKEHVLVEIRSHPPEFQELHVASVDHDGFRVDWTTPFNATTRVDYGRTPALGQSVMLPGFRSEHSIQVTDLAPSTRYHVQLVSESRSGIMNQTPVFEIITQNAYDFQLLDDTPGRSVKGFAPFEYEISMKSGGGPVQITASIQDAGRVGSPFEIGSILQEAGAGNVTVDTQRFADGDYRLIFELNRLGDSARIESPVFRIDNTPPVVIPQSPRPASVIPEVKPEFELVLIDPMGRAPPLLETLEVRVGGEPVEFKVVDDEVMGPTSIQRRVMFQLVDRELTQGEAEIAVSVEDEAGNLGEERWGFRVDHEPPRLVDGPWITPHPGPELVKPGGELEVRVELTDESQVAAATLDLSPIQGEPVPMLHATGNYWEVTVEIPPDAPHGQFELPIVAVDGLNNTGQAGSVAVTVDAQPLEITRVDVSEVDYTSARISVATSKPARAWSGDVGGIPGDAWSTTHDLSVTGLMPGVVHPVEIHAVDRSGHAAKSVVNVTTKEDVDPPSAVGDLSAASAQEGVVELSWSPATDNSGISRYIVERQEAPRADATRFEVASNITSMVDMEAPAGRNVEYQVYAVDLSDLSGPVAAVAVDVLAHPRLFDASVTPLSGRADEPFTFQVTYQHPGDRSPDRIVVHVAGETHPLSRASQADPCHDGCLHHAQVLLPTTSQFSKDASIVFEAVADGQETSLRLKEIPTVLRSTADGMVMDRSEEFVFESPGTHALILVLGAISLLLIGIRRRTTP